MRLLLAVAVALAVAGCSGGAKPKAQQKAAAEQKPRTRAEFKAAVIGKSQAEVLKVLGKPTTTREAGSAIWVYERASYDPVTGLVDSSADVLFDREGVAWSVVF